MCKVPIYSSDYPAIPGASAQTIYIQLCYSFILLYRHTYLHTELHYVLYLCFSARVMVGLASVLQLLGPLTLSHLQLHLVNLFAIQRD